MAHRLQLGLDALVSAGHLFHQRGWVPASGGNFSLRLSGRMWVTASGYHKGELTPDCFVEIDADGRVLSGSGKASDEALLHTQVYGVSEKVGSVLHTHSVASTVLSRRHDEIVLRDYELLKILEGVTTHESEVRIPVFENDQDIARLAAVVGKAMKRGSALHAYLIRGHGLYAWGGSVAQARYRVEALEFLLACELHDGGQE